MKRIICVLLMLLSIIIPARKLTNYSGNEIFPVLRNNLYFIKYDKNRVAIMKRTSRGELVGLIDQDVLPYALDVDESERFILWVSSKEDSRGVLKISDTKKRFRQTIIDQGKYIEGAIFIDSENISYSANENIYIYNLRSKEKKTIGKGIHPFYHAGNIYFAHKNTVNMYSVSKGTLNSIFENDAGIFYPVIFNDNIIFIEKKSSNAFFVHNGMKFRLFPEKDHLITLNVSKDLLIFARKFRNFDIFQQSAKNFIPVFEDIEELNGFNFKNEQENLLAIERFLKMHGNNEDLEKRAFFLAIQIKDRTNAGVYLEKIKYHNMKDGFDYYRLLYLFTFNQAQDIDFKGALIGKDYIERFNILYGNFLFSKDRYQEALKVFYDLAKTTSDSNILFSTKYNSGYVYAHLGDLWEIIGLWQMFFSSYTLSENRQFLDLVIKAFGSDLFTMWERIYFLSYLPEGEDIDIYKAKILFNMKYYDLAMQILESYDDEEHELLKLRISVLRRDFNSINTIYKKLNKGKIEGREIIVELINMENILLTKDEALLEFVYGLFPNDFRICFWYYFYLSEFNKNKLRELEKELDKNDDIFVFKKFLFGFFKKSRIAITLYSRRALAVWEDPVLSTVMGILEFENGNYERSKNHLLKSYSLSDNSYFYLNALTLSYLGKVFYHLNDYDNLEYYFLMKNSEYDFSINAKAELDDALLLARTLHINNRPSEAIDLLRTLPERQTLQDRIRYFSYLAFLMFINKNHNDSLVQCLNLIDEKEKIPESNFMLEYKMLANIYLELSDYRNAQNYALKALEELKTFEYEKPKGLLSLEAMIDTAGGQAGSRDIGKNSQKELYNILLTVYSYYSDYEKVNEYLEAKTSLLSKKEKRDVEMSIVYNLFGINNLRNKKVQDALFFFKRSHTMVNNLQTKGVVETLANIYNSQFTIGNFDEFVDFGTFIDYFENTPSNNNNRAVLLYFRTIVELNKIQDIPAFSDMEDFLSDYEVQFKNLIILERKIDELLLRKDIHYKNRAFLYLCKYFINQACAFEDTRILEAGFHELRKIPANSFTWFFAYLLDDENTPMYILNTMERIPEGIFPFALNLIDKIALENLRKGDHKRYVLYKEYAVGLKFFNKVIDIPWDFANELDNIYHKNIKYLINKIYATDNVERNYLDMTEEIYNYPESNVNFFIKPHSMNIDKLLNGFDNESFLFIDTENEIYLLYSEGEFSIVDGIIAADYHIVYSGEIKLGQPFCNSLNYLYLSKANFNYNPEMSITITKDTENIAGYGLIFADKIISEGSNFSLSGIDLTKILATRQTPYHLFLRDIPDKNTLNISFPLLLFSGFSSISDHAEIKTEDLVDRNKYEAFSEKNPNTFYYGYRGVKEDEIQDFINSKMEFLLELAIDSFRNRKWELASIYFQNFVNIYGDPLENDQKFRIFNTFIRSLYNSKKFDIAIYYLNKVINSINDPLDNKDIFFRLMSDLRVFYNEIKNFQSALNVSSKLQSIFKDNFDFLLPIMLDTISIYESNDMQKQAYDVSKTLYMINKDLEPNNYTGRIFMQFAHLSFYFQYDNSFSKEIFERGIELEIDHNKGASIERYFIQYLKNLLEVGEYELEEYIEKYGKYIRNKNALKGILGISYLRRQDLINAGKIAREIIDSGIDRIAGYNLLGLIHFELADHQRAIYYFNVAREYCSKERRFREMNTVDINISLVYMALSEYQKALDILSVSLERDREHARINDILYDLRLIVVAKSNMGLSFRKELREIERTAKEYGYPDYEYFALYQQSLTSKKKDQVLKELLEKDDISDYLRIELLYQLSKSDISYFSFLFERIAEISIISKFDIIKNGLSFSYDNIMSLYFDSAKPEEALLNYYRIQLDQYSEEQILNYFNSLIPSYQLVLLGNKIYTFKIDVDNSISMRSKSFDPTIFNSNYRNLISSIENLSDLTHLKRYFKGVIFSHIEEKNIILIPDRLLFFPFLIFEDKNIELYSFPFEIDRLKLNQENAFFSKEYDYYKHLMKYLDNGYFFILDKLDFNYKNPLFSDVSEISLEKFTNGKFIVMKDIVPEILSVNIIPYLFTNELNLIFYNFNDDDTFYLMFLRDLIENDLDYFKTISQQKDKFLFFRFYSMLSFMKTPFKKH